MNVQERVQEHYDEVVSLGYEVVGVFLQGSQNYELDYEGSDVDTKAILLPTFEQFCLNKSPISTTHVRANNEHIDLKDIRLMFECFKKQNINFIEILFTKYKVMNPKYEALFQPMLDNRELIAHYNNYAFINSMCGQAMEKYKALEHPYPTIKHKIDKYGYDPKQLHHILRIHEFITRYLNGESYEDCLVSKKKEYLIHMKRDGIALQYARDLASTYNKTIGLIKEDYKANNPLVLDERATELMNEVIINLIKHSFKEEFRKT